MKRYLLKSGIWKRKGVDCMSTLVLDNMGFKDYIAKNKEKAYRLAKENTVYNSEGKATISKNDPWIDEHEWDELYKDVTK